MKLVFCEKYGFDEKKRKGRISASGLGTDESALAEQVQRHVIHPHMDELIPQFFRIMRLDDEANRVFSRGFRDDKLQHFLANYLTSLGDDFDQPKYFEQRLRMGIAHVNAGVNLVVFQLGYRVLQQLLMDLVPKAAKNEALLRAFILKITTLDLVIATEVYQKYNVAHYTHATNGTGAIEGTTKVLEKEGAANFSRGSLRSLLSDDQVNELLLTGLQQSNSDASSCLAIAKIDELEKIEQVYGKATVEQVRQGLTARLLSTLRPGDGVGLIAGGGFIVVLSHTTLPIAEEICKRLMRCISQNPVSADKMTIPVTISLVLMLVDTDVESKELIQLLEKQLTQIQKKGVNQLEIFDAVEGVVGG
ncbi:MAG: protoglobin domain-containing protein [Gammaproteobacteria bacterium]|nr:protoglobin domain-containing protein [Gammaproteobacteria bacterium]